MEFYGSINVSYEKDTLLDNSTLNTTTFLANTHSRQAAFMGTPRERWSEKCHEGELMQKEAVEHIKLSQQHCVKHCVGRVDRHPSPSSSLRNKINTTDTTYVQFNYNTNLFHLSISFMQISPSSQQCPGVALHTGGSIQPSTFDLVISAPLPETQL